MPAVRVFSAALKVMDAIFLAVPVNALPAIQRKT